MNKEIKRDQDKCPHLDNYWELDDDGVWRCQPCGLEGAKGTKKNDSKEDS